MGRGTVWGLSLLVAGGLALAAGQAQADAGSSPSPKVEEFCAREKPVNDFGFSTLPKVTPPASAPGLVPGLRLHRAGASYSVMTNVERFGYEISHESIEPRFFGWTASARLWKLDERGRPSKRAGTISAYLGVLGRGYPRPRLTLRPNRGRGFYRFDLRFADPAGQPLATYREYIKLTRPADLVLLGLNRVAYRPGQRIAMRVENLGTGTVGFGERFGVERWTRSGWRSAPAILDGDVFLEWRGGAGPGEVGRCVLRRLPHDANPGLYRIVKPVTRDWSPPLKPFEITAQFRIEP